MTQFREEWLHNATEKITALMLDIADVNVPTVRVSAGWPSKGGTSTKKRVIGQCWKADSADDGVAQIFISPMLDESVSVLATLVHELIHAVHPTAKHQGAFIETAKAVGLKPKWTTVNASEELTEALTAIAGDLGDYPHSKINPAVQIPVQSTRMLKVQCPVCEYTVRTTQKWLDVGLPTCPDGDEMEVEVK